MFTKFFKSLVVFAVAAMMIPAVVGADAIEIGNFDDLLKIGVDPNFPLSGNYVLTGNIDASESRELNDGAGFKPIGERFVAGNPTDPPDVTRAFTGTFDGAGYTISGLYINRARVEGEGNDEHNIGLFGYIHDATVKNVIVLADTIRGYTYTGILVGRSGGESVIEQSYTSGFVTVTGNVVGGLVGGNGRSSRITACYTTATVEIDNGTGGGLVGQNSELIGDPVTPVDGGIFHSYSLATVTGGANATIGGFVGQHNAVGSMHNRIEFSYSAGIVSGGGSTTTGGFVGSSYTGMTITGCQWDTERSGQSVGSGNENELPPGVLIGHTTEQMMTRANFIGWFDPLPGLATPHFDIANNYPYLTAFPTHTLTFTSSPGGTVSDGGISGIHVQKVNHGITDASGVTAEIDEETGGESFIGWFLVDDEAEAEDEPLTAGEYDGFTVELLDEGLTIKLSDLAGDVEIEARFARKKFTVTYRADNNGKVTWEKTPEELEDELTAEVEFGALGPVVMAVPDNPNFRFHRWRFQIDMQSGVDTEATNMRADTIREAGMIFTAEFVSAGDVMLTYIAGENGSVAIVPTETSTSGTFVADTTVSVELGNDGPWILAEANTDYRFIAWSDGSTANPRRELAASGDTTVTAVFAIFTNHYRYTAGSGGKVAMEIDGVLTPFDFLLTVDYFAWGPVITAVPDSGYEFDRWERLTISQHVGSDNDSITTTATRSDSTGGWNDWFQMFYEETPGSGVTVISLDVRAVFKEHVSIAEIDRVVPETKTDEVATFVPVRTASKLVAGPSPVAIGDVVRFYGGGSIGTLRVFDALGNFVREISVADGWDLRDGKGNFVAEGSYVVRGAVTISGERVRVSVPVTVVR
ncbi:MAG: hypothetical protein LBU70_09600 [Chitinispirillales bacterium]|jgi:hypothetical protein|nr:hypothetical protein [Chitinispirillales bacterium]